MNYDDRNQNDSTSYDNHYQTPYTKKVAIGTNSNIYNEDLKLLNLQYLLLARNCAIHNPIEALWKYGMNEAMIQSLSEMTITQLHELAGCGRAVITILPPKTTNNNVPLNLYAALLAERVDRV